MAFQVGASLLDACVLAVLEQSDVYGYELTQRIKELMKISESTLYPVLRRLQKEELVTVHDMPYNGRNRRYYSITEAGRGKLEAYRVEWEEYKNIIDSIMGGNKDDQRRIPSGSQR